MQFEPVDQPPRARQAQSEPTSTGPPVLHRLVDVRDARTLVDERDPNAGAAAVSRDLDDRLTPASVDQGISGELAGGGDQLGLIDQRQTRPRGIGTRDLSHTNDVSVSLDADD